MTAEGLESLVRRARAGDREALEGVVAAVHDRIYGLAVRMLWNPEDAQDATQEILIRIVTRLSTFRGASAFTTWAYRVAVNHLLTVRKSRLEERRLTFDAFGDDLGRGLTDTPVDRGSETAVLLAELRIGCTLGMLQCLDRPHRLAYVLGEILEMEGDEAARVLGVRPAAFRKRLSRARDAVISFTRAHCGLANPVRSCRCRRRLPEALRLGRVTPGRLQFGSSSADAEAFPIVLAEIRRLDDARRAAALFRAHAPRTDPEDFVTFVRSLVSGAVDGSRDGASGQS